MKARRVVMLMPSVSVSRGRMGRFVVSCSQRHAGVTSCRQRPLSRTTGGGCRVQTYSCSRQYHTYRYETYSLYDRSHRY